MRKITAHIVGSHNDTLAGLPGAVLVNTSIEYVHRARQQLGPSKPIVVRWVQPNQNLLDPEGEAESWFGEHFAEMMAMTRDGTDRAVLFQGMNEIAGCKSEALWWFERRRMELMHRVNLPIALLGFSVGEYDPRVWPIFAPLINSLRPQDCVLGHEYWVDEPDIDNPWHCARWQLVPELARARLIVGECGRDVVEGRGAAGWRKTCNRQQFERELIKYDAKISQYPNVVFAAVFGCGWVTPDWKDFDTNELVPWLRANTEQGAPMPEPEKPKIVFPVRSLNKAWYMADQLFGPYDDHPAHSEDLNLETGGNSDLGEELVAPFDGFVVDAGDYGKGYGGIISILSFESLDSTPDLNLFRVRHCDTLVVKKGDVVKMGQIIGTIGTGGGSYAAHAHIEMVIIPMPPPKDKWYASEFVRVRPSDWYLWHGYPRGEIERLRKYDGK